MSTRPEGNKLHLNILYIHVHTISQSAYYILLSSIGFKNETSLHLFVLFLKLIIKMFTIGATISVCLLVNLITKEFKRLLLTSNVHEGSFP